MNSAPRTSRRNVAEVSTLAAAIASLLGLWSPAAVAVDPGIVTSCDDSSMTPMFGTLRYAAANVPDGGTIDLSGIPCGHISLNWANGGVIVLQQSNVTIVGPGKDALEIDGRWNQNCFSGGQPTYCPSVDRVFYHTGRGKLAITHLTISHGISPAGQGGCIASLGDIDFGYADVHACSTTGAGIAQGGAIYAFGQLNLKYATISASTAKATAGPAQGGGVFADKVFALDSTISGNNASGSTQAFGGGIWGGQEAYLVRTAVTSNTATGAATISGYGGGVFGIKSVHLENSTISGNQAAGGSFSFGGGIATNLDAYVRSSTIAGNTAYRGAGVYSRSNSATAKLGIVQSTISGNLGYRAPGVFTRAGDVYVDNSTIAFNSGSAESSTYAAGLSMYVTSTGRSLTLQSSIIAQNYAKSIEFDLYEDASGLYPITIGGSDNLLGVTKGNADPPHTSKLCPRLGPLRDNGGPTKTHALLSGSPAIDAGNNSTFAFDQDQRGIDFAPPPWSYPRLDLVAGLADIGAYEVQQDDIVFDAAFDGCAELAFAPPPVPGG